MRRGSGKEFRKNEQAITNRKRYKETPQVSGNAGLRCFCVILSDIILKFTKSSQKISTHLLTVLIMRAIVHVEQRKGIQREQRKRFPEVSERSWFQRNKVEHR